MNFYAIHELMCENGSNFGWWLLWISGWSRLRAHQSRDERERGLVRERDEMTRPEARRNIQTEMGERGRFRRCRFLFPLGRRRLAVAETVAGAGHANWTRNCLRGRIRRRPGRRRRPWKRACRRGRRLHRISCEILWGKSRPKVALRFNETFKYFEIVFDK